MSHTPHPPVEEFPDQANKILALREKDEHFAKLVTEYTDLNKQVYRSESRLDLLSEEEEEALRKRRALLKDHIWQHIK